MNPTNDAFEQRLATLDGGVGALATASGQFAQTLAILSLVNSGDEIISSSAVYGGTYTLLLHSLKRLGVTTHFVKDADPATIESLINNKTKLIYLETIGNPKLEIPDFETITKLAHHHQTGTRPWSAGGAG